jgi:hypothetical protein
MDENRLLARLEALLARFPAAGQRGSPLRAGARDISNGWYGTAIAAVPGGHIGSLTGGGVAGSS